VTDVFEEVEEGLRQDRAATLWKRYGLWVVGAGVAVIVGVGGWEAFKAVRKQSEIAASKSFSEAMDLSDTASAASDRAANPQLPPEQRAQAAGSAGAARTNAMARFDTVAKGSDAFALLARQYGAELALANAQPDPAAAQRYLEQAMGQGGVFGDLARLKLAYLRADTASLADLATLVQPLMSGTGPMASLSKELLAAKKWATNDIDGARADYLALENDLNAPEGMSQRVSNALAVLTAPAAPAPAAAASPAAGAPPAASPSAPVPRAPAPSPSSSATARAPQ
jgi:hypothetical protein